MGNHWRAIPSHTTRLPLGLCRDPLSPIFHYGLYRCVSKGACMLGDHEGTSVGHLWAFCGLNVVGYMHDYSNIFK